MPSCCWPSVMMASLLFFINGWAFDEQEGDRENLTEEEDTEEESLPHDLDYYRYKWACLRDQAVNSMIERIDNADTGLALVIILDKLKMFHHANRASSSCVKLIKHAKSARRLASNLAKRHHHLESVDAAEQAIALSKDFDDSFLVLKICIKHGLKGLLEKGVQKCQERAGNDPVKIKILHSYIEKNKGNPQEEEESESEESFDKYAYQDECTFYGMQCVVTLPNESKENR